MKQKVATGFEHKFPIWEPQDPDFAHYTAFMDSYNENKHTPEDCIVFRNDIYNNKHLNKYSLP